MSVNQAESMRAVTVMETKPSIISNVQYIHDIVCFPSGMNIYGFEESRPDAISHLARCDNRIWPHPDAISHLDMANRLCRCDVRCDIPNV